MLAMHHCIHKKKLALSPVTRELFTCVQSNGCGHSLLATHSPILTCDQFAKFLPTKISSYTVHTHKYMYIGYHMPIACVSCVTMSQVCFLAVMWQGDDISVDLYISWVIYHYIVTFVTWCFDLPVCYTISIKRFLKRNLPHVGMVQCMNALADKVHKQEVPYTQWYALHNMATLLWARGSVAHM